MKLERWQQLNDLFQLTVERAPEERPAFLKKLVMAMKNCAAR